MSIAPVGSSATTAASSQPTTASSQSSSQSSAAAGGGQASKAGGASSSASKTIVSEISLTVDGVTTTTITYSDGTVDVQVTGSPTGSQTYNANGTTSTSGQNTSTQSITA